ncbi:MAG: hypothetical protein COA39_012425 [Sulfurimonas sp.]|nr:hypothetical protein [Sulfurimonas sp.]
MPEPVLSANTRSYVGETAFANDRLDRKPLAEKLTGYLSRLNDGAVLAIDAPWGEGKTWFGRNWAKHLEDSSYKVVYVDAFEQDYVEDPFMLITSEILSIVDDGGEIEEKLKKSGIEVGKALLPFAGKALVNFVGRVALGSSDLSGEVQEAIEAGTANVADSASEYIKENLESYGKDKIAMSEFKTQLAEFALTQEKPIVIFIDELDRCKPNFAVNLVERIKHFFDVPNIVFVLLLNRDQLEKAVKGVYGSETDASAYLGKFVNFFFALPKPTQNNHDSERKLNRFIELTMQKYKFQRESQHDEFINYIKFWAPRFDMSLRDIEKATALYAFAYPIGEMTYLLTYLIVLKVKQPSLFTQLSRGSIQAHQTAKEYIEYLITEDARDSSRRSEHIFPFYLEWHEAHVNGFTEMGEAFGSESISIWHIEKKDLFSILSKKIELEIER